MKNLLPIAITALSVGIASPSFAEDNSGFHVGLKTGSIDVDISSVDVDTPIGLVFGYQGQAFGVELEATRSDVTFDGGTFFSDYKTDYKTLGLYGTYRSEGEVYFKAKLGSVRNEVGSVSDTGGSAGIGAGVRFGAASLEAEYTILDSDANFLSIGLNLHF